MHDALAAWQIRLRAADVSSLDLGPLFAAPLFEQALIRLVLCGCLFRSQFAINKFAQIYPHQQNNQLLNQSFHLIKIVVLLQ